MSLNDYLARMRAKTHIETSTPETATAPVVGEQQADTASCAPDRPVKSVLLLRCWNREVWAFPWPCFTEAHFAPGDGTSSGVDSMRLVFGSREITLSGQNLAGLMEAVARHSFWEVREVPGERMAPSDARGGAPVVWEIRVCERACAK